MTIKYGKGKKFKNGFMGICRITYPDDPLYENRGVMWWWYGDDCLPFKASRRQQSLRSIIRRIRKANIWPDGTRFVFTSWYVGHADVMIII